MSKNQEAKVFPVEPTGERIYIKRDEKPKEKKTPGGIVLPDDAKKQPNEGVVVAVGPGKLLDDGRRAPMAIQVGWKVIYAPYASTEVVVDDVEYICVDQNAVLGVHVQAK
jgi:chaperonin GroES